MTNNTGDMSMTKSEFQKEVGFRLRVARDMAGYTQGLAARAISLGRTQLVNIEQGKSGVDLYKIVKLCKYYGVSLHSIIPDSTRGRRD